VDDAPRPIRLVLRSDDLRRSRLTVFFRLPLVVPHLFWVTLWGIAAYTLAFVVWLAVLFEARAPETLHAFLASYVRYAAHVNAYLFLGAGPYPGFTGTAEYPIDVEIDPPARQNRWTAGFRLILAVPAILLTSSLTSGVSVGAFFIAAVLGAGVVATASFLGWFACLARGRMPRGLRDLVAYGIGYGAQVSGYLLLLTDRYPNSNPALVENFAQLPRHPIRTVVRDDLRRSRLTTFFRLLLALPHFVWLMLWSVAVFLAAVAAWVAALAIGRVPRPLHRFLAAYVRYASHLYAFVLLVGGPFPGFAGAQGSYPVDVEIAPPTRQHRLATFFRFFLALPALILASAYGSVLFVVALLGWFSALVRGSMPEGLRDLGAAAIRYNAQAYSYLLLVTGRYPYAAPVLAGREEEPVQLVLEPEGAPV
jgi:uncharacterized protein DUF4389